LIHGVINHLNLVNKLPHDVDTTRSLGITKPHLPSMCKKT
jgi:hypothetical protein